MPVPPADIFRTASGPVFAVPGQGRGTAEARPAKVTLSPQQETVARALRTWRAAKAKKEDVPEYSVISDAALTAIAVAQPTVPHRMAMCGGLGSAKSKKYGEEIITVLTECVLFDSTQE